MANKVEDITLDADSSHDYNSVKAAKKLSEVYKTPETASEAFTIILHRVDDYGRYQFNLMLITGLCGLFTGLHNLGAVFLAATPKHWCQIPYFEENNITLGDELKNITLPWVKGKDGSLINSRCTYFDRNYSQLFEDDEVSIIPLDSNDSSSLLEEYFPKLMGLNTTISCNSWVYDSETFKSTVVTEWELVCDKRWLMSTTQASYMLGILTGAVVFSAISDKIGRRKASLICACLFCTCGILAAFSTTFEMFLCLRFIVAASGQGMYLINYILLMECVSMKGRNVMGNYSHIFFSVGFTTLPLLAYFFRNWRDLQLAFSIPSIAVLAYFWILPESSRWLLMHGREKEGLEILKKIAKVNKRKLPNDELKSLLKIISKEAEQMVIPESCLEKLKSVYESAKTLVRTPNMRRRNLLIFYAWFVVSMLYYGLSFSGTNINASLYTSVAVAGATEFPTAVVGVLLLLKFGRRPVLCGCLLLGGLSCIVVVFVPIHLIAVNLTLTTFSKSMISIGFMLVFMFSAELVPTHVRNISIGVASMWARIGSTLAPYIVDLLGDVYYAIPSTIFGILAIISGFLCFLLPETAKRSLPESIEEIEALPR